MAGFAGTRFAGGELARDDEDLGLIQPDTQDTHTFRALVKPTKEDIEDDAEEARLIAESDDLERQDAPTESVPFGSWGERRRPALNAARRARGGVSRGSTCTAAPLRVIDTEDSDEYLGEYAREGGMDRLEDDLRYIRTRLDELTGASAGTGAQLREHDTRLGHIQGELSAIRTVVLPGYDARLRDLEALRQSVEGAGRVISVGWAALLAAPGVVIAVLAAIAQFLGSV